MINRAWLARTEPAADATSSLDARRRVVDARISAIELEVRETADQLERYDRLAQEGHAAIVDRLAAAGADLNALKRGKISALYIAAQEGHQAVVRTLLDLKADAHTASEEGFTPLMIAHYKSHAKVVDCFKETRVFEQE